MDGKRINLAREWVKSETVASKLHWIGETIRLAAFVFRPDAPAKISRIPLVRVRSCWSGVGKITTSSAYRKALSVILGCSYLRRCLLSARAKRAFKASITRTNNSGDNGSP